jgi:hypothetical protein
VAGNPFGDRHFDAAGYGRMAELVELVEPRVIERLEGRTASNR